MIESIINEVIKWVTGPGQAKEGKMEMKTVLMDHSFSRPSN